MTENDLARLEEAADVFRSATFRIDDPPVASVADIRATARSVQRKEGLALLVIDYLQRIRPADVRAKRHEQIGQITRGLKQLARELNVPILCLAQLNREVEGGSDHRPRLSHLRESEDVEQDADVVMFLHREELFKPHDNDLRGKALLIVEKNRNGVMGEFELAWDGPTMTFRTPAAAWRESGEPASAASEF